MCSRGAPACSTHVPEVPGVVRCHDFKQNMMLRPGKKPNTVEFRSKYREDPLVRLPKAVLNWFTEKAMPNTIHSMKQQCINFQNSKLKAPPAPSPSPQQLPIRSPTPLTPPPANCRPAEPALTPSPLKISPQTNHGSPKISSSSPSPAQSNW